MIIETNNNFYTDIKVNINNFEVEFTKGKANVTDELGLFMVENFDCFFEEGKIPIIEEKEDLHVYDEAMIDELRHEVARLTGILKTREGHIQTLTSDIAEWKKIYIELEKRFKQLSENTPENLPIRPDEVVEIKEKATKDQTEDFKASLEEKTFEEIKGIAKKMEVPEGNIKKKSRKLDWINAILEHIEK